MLALLPMAAAFDLVEWATWPLPSQPVALQAESTDSGWRMLAVGDDGLLLLDGAGATLATAAAPGVALAVHDADGDGVAEVWTCGDAGLAATTWSGDTFGEPREVSAIPCGAVVARLDDLVTADDAGVAAWSDDGAGGLTGPEDLGLSLSGEPLLAEAAGAIAAASRGDTTLQVIDGLGVSTLATGGALADLAGGATWTWGLSDPPALAGPDGFLADLPAAPVRLAVGEVDGDTLDDAVVLLAGGGLAVARGTGEVASFGAGGDALALADLTGDGCDDVLVLSGESVGVWAATGCGGHVDADGDGYTPDAGDCDDGDATVSPGVVEACNGVDDDCDGDVDGVPDPLALAVDEGTEEGLLFFVAITQPECVLDGMHVDWGVSADFVIACDDVGDGLACLPEDDGTAWVTARLRGPDTADTGGDTASVELVVDNVAPSISSGCSDGHEIVVHPGEVYDRSLSFYDPGDDTITVEASGGPPGLEVSPTGWVHYEVGDDTGSWTVHVELSDEDGGRRSESVEVRVEDPNCGDCGFGCSSLVFLPLAFWGLRRRQPDRNRA